MTQNSDRWVFLFILGFLAFNWPLLTIFAGSLPVFLFVLWFCFIAAAALFARSGKDGSRPR